MLSDDVQAGAAVGSGALFRAMSDGTREWPASVVSFVTAYGNGTSTPNQLQTIDATHGLPIAAIGLLAPPIALFDQTVNQAGVSQLALLFPTTIAVNGGLPAIGGGGVAQLTNGGNVCGAIFSPKSPWDSVLLDLIGVGGASTNSLTVEIGRLAAPGAVPQVLASVTLTASTMTLGPTAINPLTGIGGHASVTWRFFDAVSIVSKSQLGDVLIAINGAAGGGPSQLSINVHDGAYYYIVITSLNANWTEILATIIPKS